MRRLWVLWLGLLGSVHAQAAPQWRCYFQSTLTDLPTQQVISARVLKAWRAPKKHPTAGKKAVVRAILDRKGVLQSSSLHLRSGVEGWDDSVLQAIQKAAPYPALPKGFAYETLEFDCHVSWLP